MRTHQDTSWREHLTTAAKAFIRTAVVIDNEVVLTSDRSPPLMSNNGETLPTEQPVHEVSTPDDIGFGGDTEKTFGGEAPDNGATDRAGNNSDDEKGDHRLDLRSMSNAFAGHEIVCGTILLNKEEDSKDIPQIVTNAVSFSKHADVVIVDWKLHNDKDDMERASQQIITKLLQDDKLNKGRLRLICVYTGDPVQDDPAQDKISSGLHDRLKELKIESKVLKFTNPPDGVGPYIKGSHYLIAIVKKSRGVSEGMPETQLPTFLINAFTYIIDGLLPAFSAAAIAAIRENAHYVMSDFSADLDRAYIANRAISDPPGDVAEMMKTLLLAEFDGVVGASGVTETYLGYTAMEKWSLTQSPFCDTTKIKHKRDLPTEDLIKELFQNGGVGEKKGDLEIKEEGKRKQISNQLHENQADSDQKEARFARLCNNKREHYGRNHARVKPDWLPSLGFGTILKSPGNDENGTEDQYLLCVTPACDTIRLTGKTSMAFLVLHQVGKVPLAGNQDKFNLILVCSDDNAQIAFKLEPKFEHIQVHTFHPIQSTGRITATRDDKSFFFTQVNGSDERWQWIGELRQERVQHELHNLTTHWSRIGIDQSEWLRLSGK
ncbi:MAG: hypothetical protein G8345_21985 [Magnetococcales bacterium]|nr:hypothetical protein [Magnetococcales bacterium]